jgi:hypothetical protein
VPGHGHIAESGRRGTVSFDELVPVRGRDEQKVSLIALLFCPFLGFNRSLSIFAILVIATAVAAGNVTGYSLLPGPVTGSIFITVV